MSVLRVTEAFTDFSQGRPEVYNPGRLVDSSDPVTKVKGREGWFEPAEAAVARAAGVETATAAPGERRTRTAPRKRAPRKVPKKKAPAPAKAAPAKPPAAGSTD